MKKNKTNKLNIVLIVAVFTLIIFLRFWRVADLFNFTFSEEMQALMAWEQIKNFHPIWIGVSAANINYYLGPGFTYLNALLFYFSKGNPAILAYFSSFLGVVTAASIYYIASRLFSKNVALFSTIIYGCSTLINFHDRRFWNPTPIPFISIWLVYSLIKAKENTRWYIVTAILVGAIFHTHLSLLLFMAPILYSVATNFKRIKLSTWIMGITVYLAVTAPLLIFDIVHNYDNLFMPVRTLFGKQKADLNSFSIGNTFSHIQELLSALGRLWFIKFWTNPQDQIVLESHMDKTPGNIVLSLISVATLAWFYLKNRSEGYKIFLISLSVIMIAFILYPSYNLEYYLMSFLTLMTIVVGYALSSLPKKISIPVILIFIAINIVSTITMSGKYGLSVRQRLVEKTVTALDGRSFHLTTEGELPAKEFTYAGWRYLLRNQGATPSQSTIDHVLDWIYPDEIQNETPELRLVISDTIRPRFEDVPIVELKEEDYYSFIFKNK